MGFLQRKIMQVPKAHAILGTIIQLAILIYLMPFYFELSKRYIELSCYTEGGQKACGEIIGNMIGTLWFGGSVGLFGLMISLYTAVKLKYRSTWFFLISLALSIVYLPIFPVGTVLAIVFMVYLLRKHKEFFITDNNVV